MFDITEETIRYCSLELGRFDSESINLLVTLFHHQDACQQLILLSNNLKEKFENLLTIKKDDDEKYNDTPLTRIELAIMIRFKEKYLSGAMMNNDINQRKSNINISINDELNFAYCFLLAQIDDRLSQENINELKFLFGIRQQSVDSLYDIYKELDEQISKFFSSLIQCDYFALRCVIVDQTIRNFQLFIRRYENFITTFEEYYKSLPDERTNDTQTDAILTQNNSHEVSSFLTKFVPSNRAKIKSSEQSREILVSHPTVQQVVSSSTANVPANGLCIIINITAFLSSHLIDTPKRTGSNKDVDLIKIIFEKLHFKVWECKFDFKKDDLDNALDFIDDKDKFGSFDCLVVFIMSHGLLHSLFTADSKEVIIRDIIKRYTDSSTAIWAGKPRLFFIQACRSLWPENNLCNNREAIKENDLSPMMLVAYSCSANEASKRSPTLGSIFIQILCIMLLRYSHCFQIRTILDWTAKFIIKRDEYIGEHKKISMSIQRPEYIEREFSLNFRFSNFCLYDTYYSWTNADQITLNIPWRIWKEIYDLIFNKITSNR